MEDVAGLDEVKREFRRKLIMPTQRPDLYERYRLQQSGGTLLYGPPGTGKTLMARAVAGELDAAFFTASVSDILGKYLGESEERLRALFDEALARTPSSVLQRDVDTIRRSSETWYGPNEGEGYVPSAKTDDVGYL